VTVLKDELKIEKERYRTPDVVLEGPPAGFELIDQPKRNLLLKRTFGKEEIFVDVDLNEQEGDDEEEIDEDESSINELPPVVFTVTIAKDPKFLSVTCSSNGQYISIRNVSLDDSTAEEGDEDEEGFNMESYTGPVFSELDETLQQAFVDFLEERGITADFGYYLTELVHDKLEVEYMNWLTRVQKFVTSGASS
jgi:hypothetical protein